MRILPALTALALLAASGCTTSSRVDALDGVSPSMESTSSVRRVPPADIGGAAPEPMPAMPQEQTLQAAAPAQQPAPQPAPQRALEPALVEEAANPQEPLPIAPKADAPVQAAMIQTPNPAPRPEPQEAAPRRPGGVHGPRFRDAKPIRFARMSPKSYPVHGVDVSRWQGNINWAALKRHGANFAYIKATEGDHVDPAFRRNWNGAHAAGVRRGAYHFFFWCRSGAEQARWFIRNVPKSPGALPPVIDVEWTRSKACPNRPSRKSALKKMKSFMDTVEAHYGQRPIIYTAPDFYEDIIQGAFSDYPFWLRAVAAHPSKVYPGRKWVFWQYSGTGLSKGVAGKLDLNVFAGDAAQWDSWLGRVSR